MLIILTLGSLDISIYGLMRVKTICQSFAVGEQLNGWAGRPIYFEKLLWQNWWQVV